jgi:starch phosphorylase
VAKKHGEVSQAMFNRYVIDAITNGVHAVTWISEPFATLYDRYVAGWKQDYFSLRYALSIPKEEIWQVHAEAKRTLISYANREDDVVLTIGVARRASLYKRTNLLFTDIERLRSIVEDREGKELIKRIFASRNALRKEIRIAYLTNYDLELANLLTAGADVWLNTPEPPMEASGTSGMKAALNGVPSLSVLDGWWIERCIEDVTGWSIGRPGSAVGQPPSRQNDAAALYDKLERAVIPTLYQDRDRYVEMMRHCIALNGSFFNTHRMIQQYILKAILAEHGKNCVSATKQLRRPR